MNKYLSTFPCFLLYLLVLATSCQSSDKPETVAPVAHRVSLQGLPASCPYLTENQRGQPVLSWVQATDSADHYLLAYAVSADSGRTFGKPRLIPATRGVYPHDENLSKIIFRENGDMLAMFAVSNPSEANSYAGLVYYTQSFDGGATWTEPRQLSENSESSIDERYFDLALLPSGEVGAVWLDSRKHSHHEGSSLYFACTRGRNGFSGEKVIGTELCQCCRTDLYIDGQQRVHVAYRGILNGKIRDMMHIVSGDNGESFSPPERISPDNWVIDGCPHTGPTMTSNSKGLHYAWYTMGGGSGVFYSQQVSDATFTPREPVSSLPSAKHPQIAAFGNGILAIVWDERLQQGNRISNSVGLQLRSDSGKLLRSTHLTPDSALAVFPVLAPVAPDKLLVAYTVKGLQQGEVWYQLVQVKE